MVRTADNATEAYDAKYLSEVYQATLTAMETQAKADFEGHISQFVLKRDLTVGVLNAAGVSVLFYGHYLAYSAILFRLSQVLAGEALAVQAAVVLARWVARGLTQAVLETIRVDVYNIGAPAGP